MNRSYFPSPRSDQAAWYLNMSNNFGPLATTLGFTSAEVTPWLDDCAFAAFVLGPLTAPVSTFAQAVTGYANTIIAGTAHGGPVGMPAALTWPPDNMPNPVAPGIDGRRQRVVDKIKASPNYTKEVIGKLLRTENTGDPFDPDTYVALIRSVHENGQGQAVVVFSKAGGQIDGVNLYCQRAGDAAPVKVGQFTHTPAIDRTPLKVAGVPEERTYTIMAVIDDQEIGLRSAAVTMLIN